MAKLTVRDLDVRGKRVFMRVDYNVPMEEKDGKMVINDSTPAFTTLKIAVASTFPGATVTTTPTIGGSGAIAVAIGTMTPSATATVTFGVQIQQ